MLSSSPNIICFIHELEICEGSPVQQHHAELPTTWVTIERTLPPLLKMLTHLKRLDFTATTILHWKLLPTAFQSAFCSLIALPSLTYVRLHSWSFPSFTSLAVVLSRCSNLKALALSSTTVGADADLEVEKVIPREESGPTVRSDSAHLEVLTLDYVNFYYLAHWLLSQKFPVDVASLRELRVAHYHDAAIVEKLLLAVGNSLRHFHLKPGSWDGNCPHFQFVRSEYSHICLDFTVHSFDLGQNLGLRSIRLTLEEPDSAMLWITSLLSSILAGNVLERVGLELYIDLKKLSGWGALDALLVRPELSSLRQVEIGLFASPTHPEFIKVKEALAALESRGVLRLYQLGIKSQRSSRQLTPRISGYES